MGDDAQAGAGPAAILELRGAGELNFRGGSMPPFSFSSGNAILQMAQISARKKG